MKHRALASCNATSKHTNRQAAARRLGLLKQLTRTREPEADIRVIMIMMMMLQVLGNFWN
jgi:hypothetical protein